MTHPDVLRTLKELRACVAGWKRGGTSVGVVPTMGALHEGHLSLVRAAKASCDRVIVTIFVNPAQFNNPDDLDKYPRTETGDLEKLAPLNVDLVYAPGASEIYGQGFSTSVSVAGPSEGLCGAHRPGHFDGVATVVTKLLLQTAADHAFFGEKDYQQLQVVKRLVRDLDIPCEIIGCPTVRDGSGLALSSRNALLSEDDRRRASALFDALKHARDALLAGQEISSVLGHAKSDIERAGFTPPEYLELRDTDTFLATKTLTRPARLLVAATLKGVRLIDNIAVG